MIFNVTAIISNTESDDFAVLSDNSGRNMVIRLVDGSSASDLITGNVISFDWEPYGPGAAMNTTTNKEIYVVVEATNLTPQEVRDWGFPEYLV